MVHSFIAERCFCDHIVIQSDLEGIHSVAPQDPLINMPLIKGGVLGK